MQARPGLSTICLPACACAQVRSDQQRLVKAVHEELTASITEAGLAVKPLQKPPTPTPAPLSAPEAAPREAAAATSPADAAAGVMETEAPGVDTRTTEGGAEAGDDP